MQYSLLALSAALLATSGSAQMMPMPISNAYAPSVESFQPTPTPISTPAQASPASPMSASASASYNPMLYQHYYLTPKAKVSTFHKIASYSMSASMSIAASASASARPSSSNPALHHSIAHAANSPHGMRKPHPKEGFPMPAGLSGLQSTPDVESFNGATTKHGGYTGGNGNEENISHDGSPMPGYGPDVPAEQPIPYASDSSLRSGSEGGFDMGNVPSGGIAPVDSMSPGSVVAPVTGEKQSHGLDLGNSFCMGTCFGSKEEAKCQAPYTSPLYQAGQGCWSCCFTSPDF